MKLLRHFGANGTHRKFWPLAHGDSWSTKIGKWAEIVILCMSITNIYEFDRPRTISIV